MRTRTERIVLGVLCTLAVAVLLASPAMAQPTILRGTDLFETGSGTGTNVNFAANPIPAGFFCPGSAPFTGVVNLKGVPLATAPANIAGNSDTVVERLADGVFAGGVTNIPVVVRAMRLVSTADIQVLCPSATGAQTTFWRVSTCLCGTQPTTTLTVKVDQACGCGHANGRLDLRVCLTFTRIDTGQTVGPISQSISLALSDMPWCPNPGAGQTVVTSSFAVDTNCDNEPDRTLPGTRNFHPGWSCADLGVDCWTQYAHLTHCHPNFSNPGAHDHCVNPVCGKRTN